MQSLDYQVECRFHFRHAFLEIGDVGAYAAHLAPQLGPQTVGLLQNQAAYEYSHSNDRPKLCIDAASRFPHITPPGLWGMVTKAMNHAPMPALVQP